MDKGIAAASRQVALNRAVSTLGIKVPHPAKIQAEPELVLAEALADVADLIKDLRDRLAVVEKRLQ